MAQGPVLLDKQSSGCGEGSVSNDLPCFSQYANVRPLLEDGKIKLPPILAKPSNAKPYPDPPNRIAVVATTVAAFAKIKQTSTNNNLNMTLMK
jgi:hypothetical protein